MTPARSEPVAILCGGRGMRLRDHAQSVPKPLVEVGSRPIIWHVVRVYAAQGFRRFLLLTGHGSELIERFVVGEEWPAGVEVECLFTGERTPTGGRLGLARERLQGGTFCASYADGVADIDLKAQLDWHRSHGGLATMAVVRPRLGFGVAELDGEQRVAGFDEKPVLDRWVNGGFFCFEPGVLDHLDADSVLERAPLERLAEAGELYAWRHGGFWRCMDTYKDVLELDDLWVNGEAPWRTWG
jgi:glucose-1-phosphate cytidylyltransferase